MTDERYGHAPFNPVEFFNTQNGLHHRASPHLALSSNALADQHTDMEVSIPSNMLALDALLESTTLDSSSAPHQFVPIDADYKRRHSATQEHEYAATHHQFENDDNDDEDEDEDEEDDETAIVLPAECWPSPDDSEPPLFSTSAPAELPPLRRDPSSSSSRHHSSHNISSHNGSSNSHSHLDTPSPRSRKRKERSPTRVDNVAQSAPAYTSISPLGLAAARGRKYSGPAFRIGDAVMCNWQDKGGWYPATITDIVLVDNRRLFTIEYEADGVAEEVSLRQLKHFEPQAPAQPQPPQKQRTTTPPPSSSAASTAPPTRSSSAGSNKPARKSPSIKPWAAGMVAHNTPLAPEMFDDIQKGVDSAFLVTDSRQQTASNPADSVHFVCISRSTPTIVESICAPISR